MNESRTCPQCGAPLAADAPGGVCPQCVLKLGLEGSLPSVAIDSKAATERPTPSGSIDPGPTTPAGIGFVPPSVAELQKHFPQLEILELLGRGGMGAVYKARQPALDRIVALKILPPEVGRDPQFAERFTREARALAKLSHPNIVLVYDFGQSDGLYYLLMEFVDGVNLRQTIRSGTLKPDEALKIVPQICEALQFAHEEGVVHRDIKPENILLDKRGRLKIADFGLAKLLGRADSAVLLTGTFQVMGTLHYMAPEQFERPTTVDHRADIYSLGVVFYELLTGQLPLGRFALPSERAKIDARLDEVVLKTLEREPDRRYQHASDVKTDIDAISQLGNFTAPAASRRRAESEAARPSSSPETKATANVPLLMLALGLLLAAFFVGLGSLGAGMFVGVRWMTLAGVPVGLVFLAAGGILLLIALSKRPVQARPTPGPLPPLDAAAYEQVRRRVQGPAIALIVAGVLNFLPCVASAVMMLLMGWIMGRAGPHMNRPTMGAATAIAWKQTSVRLDAALPTDSLAAKSLAIVSPVTSATWSGLHWQQAIPFPPALLGVAGVGTSEMILLPFLVLSIPLGAVMVLGGLKMRQLELYGLVMVAAIAAVLPCTPGFIISLPIGIWALVVLLNPEVKAAFGQKIVPMEAVPEKKPPRTVSDASDEELLADPAGQTIGPGNALLVVGALSAIFWCALLGFQCLITITNPAQSLAFSDRDPSAFLSAVGLPLALAVLVGGLKMRSRRSYGWAMAASILAMLPISPICLLGFWIGGWSFLTLQASRVRRAFEVAQRQSPCTLLENVLSFAPSIAGGALVAAAAFSVSAAKYELWHKPVGTVLVYDIGRTVVEGHSTPSADDVRAFCDGRVNVGPAKLAQIKEISGYRSEGTGTRVEIGVYGDDPVVANRIEERMAAEGKLEFAILADSNKDQALIVRAKATAGADVPVDNVKAGNPAEKLPSAAHWAPVMPRCEGDLKDPFGKYAGVATRRNSVGGLEILVLSDPQNVTEKDIIQARVERNGPGVKLALDSAGGKKMRSLTSRPEYQWTPFESRRLGILVDGALYTAPHLREPIADQAMVSVTTLDEAYALAALFRRTPPGPVKKVSRKDVSK